MFGLIFSGWLMLLMLLELLHKFERRYACDIMRYQHLPDRWVAWGLVDPGQSTHWLWYFMLKLPSWSWAYNPAMNKYGMAQRMLLYVSDRGWEMRYIH